MALRSGPAPPPCAAAWRPARLLAGVASLVVVLVVPAVRLGQPQPSPQARREAARRRLLEADMCSWMWADAGQGFLGHRAAELDPLRWKTMRCEAIAEDLARYNTSEDRLRPVEIEVGQHSDKKIFQSVGEAISYLHQRDEYFQWMWADVDGPVFHKLAELDPLRWSAWMTAEATIEDLRRYRAKEPNRPVEVTLGKTGSTQRFGNIDEAISFLGGREGAARRPPAAIAFGMASCILFTAAGALGLYLLHSRCRSAERGRLALFLPVAGKEADVEDNEERPPVRPEVSGPGVSGWWLVALGGLLLGGVLAGIAAALLWGHAGSPPAPADASADACLGEADQEVWKDGGSRDFDDVMEECARPCTGRPSCVTPCIRKRKQYTAACAQCMGDLAGCTAANCMFQCMSGASPGCVQCVHATCKPAFEACSGLSRD